MRLSTRVKKLELIVCRAAVCELCGWSLCGAPPPDIKLEVSWTDPDEVYDPAGDSCRVCGRPLVLRLVSDRTPVALADQMNTMEPAARAEAAELLAHLDAFARSIGAT